MGSSDKGQTALRWIQAGVIVGSCFVLIALYCSGVSKVHEASYKVQCAKNVRDLAIACHNFHGDYHRLPTGYYGPIPHQTHLDASLGAASWVGLLPQLLPYLECDNIYKQLKIEGDLRIAGEPWWSQSANVTQAAWRLKRFRCSTELASNDGKEDAISQGLIVAIHAYNSRAEGYHFSAASIAPLLANQLGRTNYVGVMGAMGSGEHPYWDAYAGIFGNRTILTLAQLAVQDGTSNTLMLGETVGGSLYGGRNYAFSWFGAGGLPTAYGLGNGHYRRSPNDAGAAWYRFSSQHASVVQFAFADGSTRGLRFGITASRPFTYGDFSSDWSLLQQLAGRKDGLSKDTANLID
jgi:uncharacterized protein DUF1559